MFRTIWQIMHSAYTRRRSGIDVADIEHLRADLRFRLALVEYAYFGASGKRVARSTAELKSLLGDKAMHRYLKSLDPDLRTQFVERFQGSRRESGTHSRPRPRTGPQSSRKDSSTLTLTSSRAPAALGSNVVPIHHAARKTGTAGGGDPVSQRTFDSPDDRSADEPAR
ncbi:MAG: hypothetical protein WB783_09695 [Arenicellales bacterium]